MVHTVYGYERILTPIQKVVVKIEQYNVPQTAGIILECFPQVFLAIRGKKARRARGRPAAFAECLVSDRFAYGIESNSLHSGYILCSSKTCSANLAIDSEHIASFCELSFVSWVSRYRDRRCAACMMCTYCIKRVSARTNITAKGSLKRTMGRAYARMARTPFTPREW